MAWNGGLLVKEAVTSKLEQTESGEGTATFQVLLREACEIDCKKLSRKSQQAVKKNYKKLRVGTSKKITRGW